MDEIQEITGKIWAHLRECYGSKVQQVILYGSYAWGEATPKSDVDLLVVDDSLVKEEQDFIAKAERFLQSAEHLFALGDYDSRASRCYYAMFFLAEAALMLKGIRPSSHRGVISLFGQHFIHTGIFPAELGRALSRAYDVRLTGDYAVGLSVSQEEAENLLEAARLFVDEVRAYMEKGGNPMTDNLPR